jgi:hypothetical protein
MNLSNVEPVSHEGKTNSWYTPKWIFEKCGDFKLDPCGDLRWPIAELTYTEKGLENDWYGRVWLNPPYGRSVGKWTKKLIKHGNGLCLVFARTDTKWFQEIAKEASWILFIKNRVRFVDASTLEESSNNPGAPSCLIAIGNQPVPKIAGVLVFPSSHCER